QALLISALPATAIRKAAGCIRRTVGAIAAGRQDRAAGDAGQRCSSHQGEFLIAPALAGATHLQCSFACADQEQWWAGRSQLFSSCLQCLAEKSRTVMSIAMESGIEYLRFDTQY